MFLHTPTKSTQVDFRKEARHIQEFSSYLDASGMRSVATCPFVYKGAVHPAVGAKLPWLGLFAKM